MSREAAAAAATLKTLNQGTKAENTRLASELTAPRINLEAERERSSAPSQDNEAEVAALRGQLAESKREAAELKVQHAEKVMQLKRVCDNKSREARIAKSKFEALAEECEPYKIAMKKTEWKSYTDVPVRQQYLRWAGVTPLLRAWRRMAGSAQSFSHMAVQVLADTLCPRGHGADLNRRFGNKE